MFFLESQSGNSRKYLLVLEYADSGTLQNYLRKKFNDLTWKDKFKLAFQLSCAVSCLHGEGIVHRDLVISSLFLTICYNIIYLV
jgi:serine/threonine protein kinase